jgi:hypothetical protein
MRNIINHSWNVKDQVICHPRVKFQSSRAQQASFSMAEISWFCTFIGFRFYYSCKKNTLSCIKVLKTITKMPGNIVDENAFTKVHSIFFYRNRMILKILQIWTSWILKLKSRLIYQNDCLHKFYWKHKSIFSLLFSVFQKMRHGTLFFHMVKFIEHSKDR